ncbi:MAG: acetate kinase [Bryobacteraceae bacterium]|nr:acetate kinase [Bryobacteraceae bacterium]
MKILAVNCGSSTVKFQLFETSAERAERNEDRALARGMVDKVGAADSSVSFEPAGADKQTIRRPIRDHHEAVEASLATLTESGNGLLRDLSEIAGVGHRVVHGGEYYSDSVLFDDEVERRVEECVELAPLHNPHNLTGYRAVKALLPRCPNVAVFDTAFHQTIPRRAFLYALPLELYSEHKIRRYGFHGTSHRYVSQRYAQIHGAGLENLKLIACHLGNGCSMTAIDRGRSVDNTLGLTPIEGLVMGTRPGDVDPGVVLHLMSDLKMTVEEVTELLNKRSGLLGLSGETNDMRSLMQASEAGDERARLAIEIFCYRIKKYIGAYLAALNGADAILFTGGIGENAPAIRARACEALDALGVALDPGRNERARGAEAEISADGAKVKAWVIPTNEELLIARETMRCISVPGVSGVCACSKNDC